MTKRKKKDRNLYIRRITLVPDENAPLCKDCVFVRVDETDLRTWLQKLLGRPRRISDVAYLTAKCEKEVKLTKKVRRFAEFWGAALWRQCSLRRGDERLCGPQGRYFVRAT